MVEYMKRFGFYSDPPLDYPGDQMAPSGAYNSSGDLVTSGFDVGRVAIGQGGAEGQDLTTPLQMAEVAATVANGGKLMRPTFVQQVTDSGRAGDRQAEPQVAVHRDQPADGLRADRHDDPRHPGGNRCGPDGRAAA